jgi:DNA adenine methylase
MNHYSPLRYPGGKGKLTDFMKLVFRENLLCDGYYVEPYAGGASVALGLLLNEYVAKIVINDLDRSLYAFWYAVINKSEELCDLIEKVKLDVPTWQQQREVQRNKLTRPLLELGFSTFYLNRTNRSGILNGGIIGGLKQTGEWKIDARFNKKELINRIRRIAAYKNRIEVYNLDACDLLQKISSRMPKKALFYLDPPYFLKGRALYVNYYKPQDHASVADMITGFKKHRWIVSYDYTPEVVKLYRGFRRNRYSINYSAAKYSKGKEVMIFSDNLFIPKVKSPVQID